MPKNVESWEHTREGGTDENAKQIGLELHVAERARVHPTQLRQLATLDRYMDRC